MAGIEVHVRIRPVGTGSIWSASDSLLYCTAKQEARFMFHRVHPASIKNETLFHTLEPLVHAAFGGQNVTVMAYGQTGSGKTHCCMGTPTDTGLVIRAAKTMIDLVHNHSADGATLSCGFIEVYNEVVTDLLAEQQKLDLKQQQQQQTSNKGGLMLRDDLDNGNTIVADRLMVPLRDEADFAQAINRAEGNRRYGETDLNDKSSRSHVILTFEVSRCVSGTRQKSLLQFVDLAGSECAGKANTEGSALREGGYINKSLLMLGNVVDAIVDKRAHVPFRDSKLTRILKNCIGGKSLTFLICCINPTKDNYDQTLTSLRFAQRAMKVTSDPGLVLNMAPLLCHSVARSIRHRERMMAEREQREYERGIQDAYLQCREGVGNIMSELDQEAKEILDQFQVVTDTVLAHDQQRGLQALQDAQQVVHHNGHTLASSEDALRAEEARQEKLNERRFQVDEMKAQADAELASVIALEKQLEADREDLARHRIEAANRELEVCRVQHQAMAVSTECQYWTELNDISTQHLQHLFPDVDLNTEAAAPITATTQLRQLQQYKARIAKEKKELDDLTNALKTINECLVPDAQESFEVCEIEDAQLAAHIESVEASQRAARAASNHNNRGVGSAGRIASASPSRAPYSTNSTTASPRYQQQQQRAIQLSQGGSSVQRNGGVSSLSNTPRGGGHNINSTTNVGPGASVRSPSPVTLNAFNNSGSTISSNNNNISAINNISNNSSMHNNNNNSARHHGSSSSSSSRHGVIAGGAGVASSTPLHTDGAPPPAAVLSSSSAGSVSNTNNSGTTATNSSNVSSSSAGPRATLEALRAVQSKWLTAEDRADFAASQLIQHHQRNTSQQQHQQNRSSVASSSSARGGVFGGGGGGGTPSSQNRPFGSTSRSTQMMNQSGHSQYNNTNTSRTGRTPNTSQTAGGGGASGPRLPLSPRPRDEIENVGPGIPDNTAARAAARKKAAQKASPASASPAHLQTKKNPTPGAASAKPSGKKGSNSRAKKQVAPPKNAVMRDNQHRHNHNDQDDDHDDDDSAGSSEDSPLIVGIAARRAAEGYQPRPAAVAAMAALVERNLFQSPLAPTPAASGARGGGRGGGRGGRGRKK